MKHLGLPTVVVVLGMGVLAGCSDEPPPRPVRPVRVIRVADVEAMPTGGLPGRARATQEVNLSFRVSGPLVSLPIEVGDEVTKGQVLAQIDPRDYEVALRSVEAALDRTRANLKAMTTGARPEELEKLKAEVRRMEAEVRRWRFEYDRLAKLREADSAAETECEEALRRRDVAETSLRQAQENLRIGEVGARDEDIQATEAEIRSLEAAVDAARDQLAYTHLQAPFDGIVAATYVENYETVMPRTTVLRLLDHSRIEMVVNVPESSISLRPFIERVTCRFDVFPDIELVATFKEVGTEASETTRTYPVTLIMDQPEDARILPGMAGVATALIKLPGDESGVHFEIPTSAVFAGDDGKQYVWLVDEASSTVERHVVEPGALTALGIMVAGIEPGQMIVTAGVHYLSDGQRVRLSELTAQGVTP